MRPTEHVIIDAEGQQIVALSSQDFGVCNVHQVEHPLLGLGETLYPIQCRRDHRNRDSRKLPLPLSLEGVRNPLRWEFVIGAFSIQKPDGALRKIFDLSHLNSSSGLVVMMPCSFFFNR
jgi:hypothetical protein